MHRVTTPATSKRDPPSVHQICPLVRHSIVALSPKHHIIKERPSSERDVAFPLFYPLRTGANGRPRPKQRPRARGREPLTSASPPFLREPPSPLCKLSPPTGPLNLWITTAGRPQRSPPTAPALASRWVSSSASMIGCSACSGMKHCFLPHGVCCDGSLVGAHR